jgi:hypothetical protein
MRGVARVGRKGSRVPSPYPFLADRRPYELKQQHRCLDGHHCNLMWEALPAEFGPLAIDGHVTVPSGRQR